MSDSNKEAPEESNLPEDTAVDTDSGEATTAVEDASDVVEDIPESETSDEESAESVDDDGVLSATMPDGLDDEPAVEAENEAVDEEASDIPDEDVGEPSGNDLHFVLLHGEEADILDQAIAVREAIIGGTRPFQQAANEFGSYDNILLSKAQVPYESRFGQKRIKDAADTGMLSHILRDREGKVRLGGVAVPAITKDDFNKLKGQAAVQAFRQKTRRGALSRIPLYNSGFYIELVGPSQAQLYNFASAAEDHIGELGRSFGAAFYLHLDHFAKAAAVRLFRPLISNATLHNWDKGDTLLNHIKLEDYDVILMAIARLMYPKGFPGFRHACTNTKKCSHVNEVHADLAKLVLTDYSKLSRTAIAHMRRAATTVVTPAEIADYQKELAFTTVDLEDPTDEPNLIRWENYGVVLKSASFFRYIAAGSRYLDNIRAAMTSNDPETMERTLLYRAYRQLSPWISEIRTYDDKGEYVSLRDEESIEMVMDDVQTDDIEEVFFSAITDAINNHKISHVGIPVYDCPACGHTPDIPSGYFTIDPMETFFLMCVRKLAIKD